MFPRPNTGNTRRLGRATGAILSAAALVTLSACGSSGTAKASDGMPKDVTIGYQPGLSYAPLLLLKQDKTLEHDFPNTTFHWKELSSSSAIQDGMVAGDIQVGAGSAAQMILAWDKGVKWHYLSSMNDADLWLMAKSPKYQTLKDFGPSDKIAMPSPTSVQALVLRKAADEKLGKATALDTNIVAMAHPDGVQNLISGQIAGHLTSPPFEFEEKDQGAHIVVSSKDVFGPMMFNGVFMMNDYYDQNTKFAKALYDDIAKSVDALRNDVSTSAKTLSEESDGQTSATDFESYLKNPAITFTTEPHGLEKIASFMKQIGIISKTPGSWKDLTFAPAQSGNGS